MELQRSVNRWHISKEDIESQKIGKQKQTRREGKQAPEPQEEITPLLILNGEKFHFQFYEALEGEAVICMINETSKEPFVMKKGKSKRWKIITPVGQEVVKEEKQLSVHADKLFEKQYPANQ
jgi:hypothetical protein